MQITTPVKLIVLVAAVSMMPFTIGAGCAGDDGGNNSTNVGSMLGGLSGIPGIRSSDAAKLQQGQQLVDVGGKGLDVLSIESPRRQDQIGQTVAVSITNKYPLSTNDALNDYVNLVGLTVASVSPNPEISYAFGVLETDSIGAYSAPGGYVFITRGALKLIEDEAELAAVLAHEVAHVAKNHGIDAVRAAKGKDFFVAAAKTQSEFNAIGAAQADAVLDVVMIKGYSQQQERQSDSEAVKYLAAAGYDPSGLARFLTKLQASQRGATGRAMMSTHPGTAERVAGVQRQIQSGQLRGATLKDRYAANVKLN